jgi:hypothetical protein
MVYVCVKNLCYGSQCESKNRGRKSVIYGSPTFIPKRPNSNSTPMGLGLGMYQIFIITTLILIKVDVEEYIYSRLSD